MITFSLVRIGAGEPANRPVELVGLAHVPGDHRRTGGSSVALGEQAAANAHVVGKRVTVEGVERDAAFHVAELPDVVLATGDGGPAEQRIGHGLQPLLVFDNALSLVGVPGGIAMHVAGDDGATGLFELQENDVFAAAALAQHDICAEADAAHPNDFVGDIDNGVAAENLTPLRGEGVEIVVKRGGEQVGVLDRRPA